MDREYTYQPGMDVVGSDGEKVGKIVEVHPDYVVVEKGFFFPKDHFIPTSAIGQVGADDTVYLSVTKDEALNQGWDNPPTGYTETGTGYADDSTYATGGGLSPAGQDAVATASGVDYTDTSYGGDPAYRDRDVTGRTDTEVIGAGYVADTGVAASGQDAVRVPVYEEDLTAVKREVDRGAVRIEKDVVTEDRVVDVPLTEERVRVSRVEGGTGVTGDASHAFEEGVIEVPLRGQEVELEKTAHVAGEVVVEKEAVQRTQRAAGTVRREEVRVDDETLDAGITDDPNLLDRGATS